MKIALPVLFVILFTAPSFSLFATHQMGVDISYECIGPCTWRIYHKSYYDCAGNAMIPLYVPPVPANAPSAVWANLINGFNITGANGCPGPVPSGNWVFVDYDEVTPLCPDALNPPPGTPHPTLCDPGSGGATINGVAELIYYRDFDFCAVPVACDSFTIQWSDCCRNGVINSGAANANMYTGSTVIKPNLSPCNNSPQFLNKPVPYICAGQPFTFNQGAYDPDGDSLSYSLGNCMATAGVPVNYLPGFSATQPLGPTWSVSVNAQTGDITMVPNTAGNQVVGVMCVVVEEWRNGQKIGQVTRDMQITVLPNCATSNPITQGVQNLAIGVDQVPADPLSYSEVRTCAGVETCFDIPVVSQDPGLDYQIYWNMAIPGASFTDANNPAVVDTISGPNPVGKFCWTPPPGTNGSFLFVVSVQDDACPIPGFNQFTIIVNVEDVLSGSGATAIPVDCNEIDFTALPTSTIPGPYSQNFTSFQWGGNGNLNLNPNNNDSTFSHFYPAPASYVYDLSITDTFGCKVSLGGIANLNTGVIADAGPDVTICSNYNFTLGSPALPGLSYSWSPATALSNTQIAQPTFILPNGGLVQNSITYTLTVTDGICTTYDYITVTVNPSLQATIQPQNPVICAGAPVTLTAQSNLGPGTTWLWSNGDTTQSITVNPGSNTTFSVVAFNNGCASNTEVTTVSVQSGPPVQIAGDLQVCRGESATLTAFGGVSYQWSVGGWSNPNITISNITQDTTLSVVAYDAQGCPGQASSITVSNFSQPVAGFNAQDVCHGEVMAFSDNATVADGAITQYMWDFGDGGSSATVNPNYTYANFGTWPVKQVVMTNHGCRDSVTQSVMVHAVPEADFSFTNACEGQTQSFASVSSIGAGGTITDLVWDFGDGSPAMTGINATHIYNQYGYYNVSLTAIAASGCAETTTRTIFTHPNPMADFSVKSACQDSVVFTSNASVIAGSLDYIQTFAWEFGDPSSGIANTSDWSSPYHVYQQTGTYPISLIVTTGNGCADSITMQVEVFPTPEAAFTYEDNCANENTRFTDLSTVGANTPLTAWSWDFGQGIVSSKQNPAISFSGFGPGVYEAVFAIATSENCVDTMRKEIIINPVPAPSFVADARCFMDTSHFINQSSILSGQIINYSYDFGDGSLISALPQPDHFYTQPGNWKVTLTAVSDSGCISSFTREVVVHPLPEIIRIDHDTICFSDKAQLAVIADPEVAIEWYYELNGGAIFNTGNSYQTPPLPYQTTYYVMPRSKEGCVNDRLPVEAFVYPAQDMVMVSDLDRVDLPLGIVNFATASTSDPVRWQWNFGDGNTSDDPEPAHAFAYAGKYEVIVTTTDINGCEETASKLLEVRKITNVHLPNAFSPNQDGVNDTYRIGHYNISQFNIQIFNRWGQLVFQSENPDFEWNGTSLKGDAVQEGVYVYVLKAKDFDGNSINESRTVTVIR